MFYWDYDIPKNFQPSTDEEWIWYIERQIYYNDWKNIPLKKLLQYKDKLKLDEGKQLLLNAFLKYYESGKI
ncbi:MAG: hypothetical protein Fur0023_08900 [Bacteroidia bacterium]